ncbi:hypothetical protein C7S13_2315 [Burkholderia cepacia]|nr:hypothetical protein [Burkholderia cepacia]
MEILVVTHLGGISADSSPSKLSTADSALFIPISMIRPPLESWSVLMRLRYLPSILKDRLHLRLPDGQ